MHSSQDESLGVLRLDQLQIEEQKSLLEMARIYNKAEQEEDKRNFDEYLSQLQLKAKEDVRKKRNNALKKWEEAER